MILKPFYYDLYLSYFHNHLINFNLDSYLFSLCSIFTNFETTPQVFHSHCHYLLAICIDQESSFVVALADIEIANWYQEKIAVFKQLNFINLEITSSLMNFHWFLGYYCFHLCYWQLSIMCHSDFYRVQGSLPTRPRRLCHIQSIFKHFCGHTSPGYPHKSSILLLNSLTDFCLLNYCLTDFYLFLFIIHHNGFCISENETYLIHICPVDFLCHF